MDSPLIETFFTPQKEIPVPPNLEKNAKIREKRKQTLIRRNSQEARTFELKINKSKVSKTRLTILNRFFLEAKWFTNYITGNGVLNFKSHVDYKVKKGSGQGG